MLVIRDDLVIRSGVVRRASLVLDCEQSRGRHDVWSGETSDANESLPKGDRHRLRDRLVGCGSQLAGEPVRLLGLDTERDQTSLDLRGGF